MEDLNEKVAKLKKLADEIAGASSSEMSRALGGESQIAAEGDEVALLAKQKCPSGFFCGKYNCKPPFSCSDYGCTSKFTVGATTRAQGE
jgi:hypothetical protein